MYFPDLHLIPVLILEGFNLFVSSEVEYHCVLMWWPSLSLYDMQPVF